MEVCDFHYMCNKNIILLPVTFLTTKIDIQCQVEMDKVSITGEQNVYFDIVPNLVSYLNRSVYSNRVLYLMSSLFTGHHVIKNYFVNFQF